MYRRNNGSESCGRRSCARSFEVRCGSFDLLCTDRRRETHTQIASIPKELRMREKRRSSWTLLRKLAETPFQEVLQFGRGGLGERRHFVLDDTEHGAQGD